LEKAIEIKRRAQRCVQNGDLDGALREYEKLVETPESDPYNFVLLADLLFKKGDQRTAAERYLHAVTAYEKAGLYKNAIAVCKKMMRLTLSQSQVLKHLAQLHALDGLASEASIYYAQFAEQMLRANNANEAAAAYRKAFDTGQENIKYLEQMADALLIEGQSAKAAETLREAAGHYQTRRQEADARRCTDRAKLADPASAPVSAAMPAVVPPAPAPESAAPPAPTLQVPPPAAAPPALAQDDGFETPRAFAPPTSAPAAPPSLPPVASGTDSGTIERSPAFRAPAPPAAAAPPTVAPAPARLVAPVLRAPGAPLPVAAAHDDEPAVPAEGVYDIGADDAASYEHALNEAQTTAPAIDPYEQRRTQVVPSPSTIARRPPGLPGGASRVEGLLQRAQDDFRAGRRDAASSSLVEAARAYEELGRLDSAATIFRSLGRGAQSPTAVMELWLENCQKRGDRQEGSQVACELGDRSLNDGQDAQARAWFEHASALDPTNDTARRRLQRLTPGQPNGPAPSAQPASGEMGRVEVAVGRGQAVTFDLEGLLQEFQRGVDSQLEGDAQGHYDMGMAYREMGLNEQAVESFRIAQRDPRLALLCHEMIGRCHADASQHDAAVREFAMALRADGLDAAGEAELRYQTAMSLAALGDPVGAVAQLEIADMRHPGRPDVVQRLTEWRRTFGKAA